MAKKQRRIPIRTCIACRDTSDKRSLTRLVRTPEGILVDPTGKLNGRGAYLCDQAGCWEKATKHIQIIANALKATPSEDDISRLRQHLAEVIVTDSPAEQ